ncbi:hypothetical protein C0991_007133 [Blastosporella zonata]|nr:hypothetical protein C0991_007133 [Blastosporella zonata]
MSDKCGKPVPVVGYDYWVVPYFTPVFRTIIICRFLLMLRTIYYDDREEADTHIGSLRFGSRVVGPLGTTIDPELDFEDSFDDATEDSQAEDDRGVVYSREPFFAGMEVA